MSIKSFRVCDRCGQTTPDYGRRRHLTYSVTHIPLQDETNAGGIYLDCVNIPNNAKVTTGRDLEDVCPACLEKIEKVIYGRD